MYHLHVTRNLRSIAFLLVTFAILGALGALWWANRTGLPEPWRVAIERSISKQGAHVKIHALRYRPLHGVVASEVRVFSDPEHKHEISRLKRVILNFDKTKLARGIVHLNKIELRDATLVLPVNPDDPASESLEIVGVNGTLFMPGDRRFEVRNGRGRIAGIDLNLNARIIGFQQQTHGDAADQQRGQRRELLAKIIHELKNWHFDPEQAPKLTVFLEGDVNDRSSITAQCNLLARGVEKNQHQLREVSADAEITGDLLTVTSLRAEDTRGTLHGSLDFDLNTRQGRFDLRSSLEIPRLLTAWLEFPPLSDILIGGSQTLEAEGGFSLDGTNAVQVQLTGHARCESFLFRGVPFDTIESSFAVSHGDIFLKNVKLTRPDGVATGKVMIQPPLVRLALESTIPPNVCQPFFVGKPLERVLGDFSERDEAAIHVTLEGGFDTSDRRSWAFTGAAGVKNYSYRGVPVNSADCRMSLSAYELDFFNGTVDFDYRRYPLRNAFSGPDQATAKVGRIRYDGRRKLVEVERVTGNFWAAPMVRLFAPEVADSIEDYRFHRPPALVGDGIVDVTPQGRTALDVSFQSKSPANYVFLGEDITLEAPSGKVAIRGKGVTVSNLETIGFDGPVAARFDVPGNGRLEGEIQWTRISIPALSSAYDFQTKSGGTCTGRIEFSITDGRVETMAGSGLLALEKTELLSVPMFGPLSPLISGVLKDKEAGFERAKSAFCTYRIRNGILSTHDFHTATTSLAFVGDGSVDLKERSLDMTVRMNARGLLGLLTLPLRPLYGMFQFKGTGPLKNPDWQKVMFTPPSEEQQELLKPAPKARVVTGKE